jgi:hypothetical protein
MKTWNQAVDSYLQRLSILAYDIDEQLDSLRIGLIEQGPSKMDGHLVSLTQRLQMLEQMVLEREQLLRDPSAPPDGFTLREKLLSTRRFEDGQLARRGEEIVQQIADTQNRATAMFVCQYHLSELTADILRTLRGERGSQTYGPKNGTRSTTSGGSLFNGAA